MTFDEETLAQLRGKTLVAGSDEVGEIEEVYAHASEDLPALVVVDGKLVPLPQVEVTDGQVNVPFGADAIAGAPAPSGDVLAEDEFEQVYAHYGIADASLRADTGHPDS